MPGIFGIGIVAGLAGYETIAIVLIFILPLVIFVVGGLYILLGPRPPYEKYDAKNRLF